VFNNLTVATPTYTMAYKYAAFDGFKRLAATGVSLKTFESEYKSACGISGSSAEELKSE
jgi:hypothetical protein